MEKPRIFIDGEKTRQEITKITGKVNGIKLFCEERGIDFNALNTACRKGYVTPHYIDSFLIAGVPLAITSKPLPSRRKKEHTKKKPEEPANPMKIEVFKLTEEETIPDTDKTEAMKHLIIAHLTSLLDDLKKL